MAPANDGTANVVFSQSNATNIAELDANWSVASVFFNTTPGLGVEANQESSIGVAYETTPTLTIQQGGITNASTYPITIDPSLVVAQPQTWNIAAGGGLLVSNVSGAGSITKTGAGTLTFSTQNTFTGGFEASGGVTDAANGSSSLGPDGTSVTLSNSATIGFSRASNTTTPYAVAFNHPLTLGNGGGTLTIFNGTLSSGSLISGPGALTLGSGISSGQPTTGIYTLTGTNTYAGGTIIDGGVTAIFDDTNPALGSGNVTVQSGGLLELTASSNLGPGSQVILQDGTTNLAPGTLLLNDPALVPGELVGASSTGGVVALGDFTYTTPLDLSTIGNGKVALGSGSPAAVYAASTLAGDADGVYRLGGGTVDGVLTINGAANVLTGANAVAICQSPGEFGDSVLSGSSSNAVTIALANNYTGGTTLYGGTLAVGDDHALGSGPLTFAGGTFTSSNGERTLSNPLVLTSVVLSGSNDLTFSGPVDLGGATGAVTVYNSDAAIVFSNVISNGALDLGGGLFTLSAANTFVGGLTLSSAMVSVESDASLGGAGGALNLADGTLNRLGHALTVNRPVTLTFGNSVIATNGGLVTLNGPVTSSNPNATLIKRDTGTLVLTNLNNTAPITVTGGTLQIDNFSNGQPGKPLTVYVNNGATLAGVGPVGFTNVSNGHIAPGDNGPGALTFSNYLVLADGTVFDFDLGPDGADKMVVNSNLFQIQTINNQPLVVNFADSGGLAPGQTYQLINWGASRTSGVNASAFILGSSPVGGTFSVANNSLSFTTAAYTPYQQWQYTYFGSINNPAAAPTANPAGDGIPNLLKYALGLDPRYVETAGLPKLGLTANSLTLTYTRPVAVTDVVYDPQFSNDLTTWSDNGVAQVVVSSDGTTQTILASIAFGGNGRRFIRLNVSSP